MKPKLKTITTTGSLFHNELAMHNLGHFQGTYTLNPSDTSSVYSFNIVELLPPTPAALVPNGLAVADAFFCSVARRLLVSTETWIAKTYLMRVFAPPGGGGELGRAGDDGVEDYKSIECHRKK